MRFSMKCKSVLAIIFTLLVATSQATEKQSLLSRVFGAVFSSAQTVKEKAFYDTHNQIASVTTVGLVSAILGWFGYKKYQKHKQLIPQQKSELRAAIERLQSKAQSEREALEQKYKKQEQLKHEITEKKNMLFKAAVHNGIIRPKDKKRKIKEEHVLSELYLNSETSVLLEDLNRKDAEFRMNQAHITKYQNLLASLEKKQEHLRNKEQNFGFWSSFFYTSRNK